MLRYCIPAGEPEAIELLQERVLWCGSIRMLHCRAGLSSQSKRTFRYDRIGSCVIGRDKDIGRLTLTAGRPCETCKKIETYT